MNGSMTVVPALMHAIDEIDEQIIALLARRFAHAREIGKAKRGLGQPPYDPERMRSQGERFVQACVGHGLDEGMGRLLIGVIGARVLAERLEIFRSPPDQGS